MGEKTTHLEIYPKTDAVDYQYTIQLRGDKGFITAGGNETDGYIVLYDKGGSSSIKLFGSDGLITLGGVEPSIVIDGGSRNITLLDTDGRNTIKLGGEDASIISGDKGKAG